MIVGAHDSHKYMYMIPNITKLKNFIWVTQSLNLHAVWCEPNSPAETGSACYAMHQLRLPY